MRKNHWKALAVAAVLMMTVPALLSMAADKPQKAKPADKTTEQMMPGCSMHGGADKDADVSGAGCCMKGGKGMAGCSKHGGDMKDCCMKGGKGMAGCSEHGGDMKGCGMKGGKEMAGCSMHGGDMKGCATKGGKEMTVCVVSSGDMKGRGKKGSKEMTVCVVPGGDMKGCGMKGGMGKGMPGCGMRGEMGGGMAGGPMCGPGMGAGHGAMMLKGLDLTADQQKKVAAIHERQARLMVQAQADLRIATMDLQQSMRADTPDKAKIDAQIDKVAQMRAGMQKSHTATVLEVRALLTPQQLKKFPACPMGGMEEND